MRTYARSYAYTPASAVAELQHVAAGAGFTRTFDPVLAVGGPNDGLAADRLRRITTAGEAPSSPAVYAYDGAGRLVREGTARHTAWAAWLTRCARGARR